MSSCPSRTELEHLAAAGEATADLALSDHLETCAHCKSLLGALVEENLLLSEIGEAVRGVSREVPAPPQARTGQTVGGYRLEQCIYSGGQATVFQASSMADGQRVALKIWDHALYDGVENRLRFQRELETVQSLDHPFIVEAIGGEIADGVGYLVMHFIDGKPVDRYADERRSASDGKPRELCELMLHICSAVAFAHARGIIHRDLKPANILVQSDGSPKVLDFGLAKAIAEASNMANQLTATGQFLGTLAFASPEQTCGRPEQVDVQSDVYSLGVIFYRILTGRMPYATAGPPAEVLSNIQSATIEKPSRWNPEIDRDLDAILMKALERDKRDRYATANALQSDLQSYLRGDVIEARRSSRFHLLTKVVRRHAIVATMSLTILASLVLAVVLGGIALIQTRRSLALSSETLAQQHLLTEATHREQLETAQRAYHASITAATMAGDPRSAREWLFEAPAAHRHWEWQYLTRISDQTDSLFRGHDRYVEIVRAANPTRLLSTSWDGTVKLWDLKTNEEIASRTLDKHVWALTVSPDGERAAVGDFSGRIHIISANDLSTLHVIQDAEHAVFGACFSQDGSRLACCFSEFNQRIQPPGRGMIRVYETENWEPRGATQLESSLRSIVQMNDDQWFVNGLTKSAIASMDAGVVQEFPASTGAAYDLERERLYIATIAGELQALSKSDDYSRPEWTTNAGVVNELALSVDGKRLAVAGRVSAVRVFNALDGQQLHQRVGHDWAVSTCSWVDERYLASGGWDKTVRVWDVAPASSSILQLHGHTDQITALKPFGKWVLTGSRDQTLRVWDGEQGQLMQTLDVQGIVWSIDILKETGELVCGLSEGQLFVGRFEVATGRIEPTQTWSISTGDSAVHDARFVSVDRAIACTSSNLLVEVETNTGRQIQSDHSHRGHIHRIRLLPGDLAATADHDRIRVWRIGSFEAVHEISRSIFQDDFSLAYANGNIIAGRFPGQIGIWNLSDSEPIHTLNGHGDEILDLAIHPDQTRMVSCSSDGSTKIWDLTRYRLLTVIQTDSATVTQVEFDPSGHILYGGTKDGRLFVWDMRDTSSEDKQLAAR